MSDKDRVLERVQEDALALEAALQGSNAPVEEYIDLSDAQALTDTLSLPHESWSVSDLEKILIIRDGLYAARNALRDKSEAGEHSVDAILSATDRLYADLERALRELHSDLLPKARNELAARQEGKSIETWRAKDAASPLQTEARTVLVESHNTRTKIELNLFKIDNVNVDVLRHARLSVQRFSASVFAIKISLEQSVVFQGVFQFLHETVDRILDEIRSYVEKIKAASSHILSLATDLRQLAEVGTRFTRMIGEFMEAAFSQDKVDDRSIKFTLKRSFAGDAIYSNVNVRDNLYLCGGKGGAMYLADLAAFKIYDQKSTIKSDILCLAKIDSDKIAFGTSEGLQVNTFNKNEHPDRANLREAVISATTAPWGGRGVAVITASREGFLRRWSLAGGITQYRSAGSSRDTVARIARSSGRLLTIEDRVIAASGSEILVFDSSLDVRRRISVQFPVTDMAVRDGDTLIACGHGNLAHVNLSGGTYSRILASSADQAYAAVEVISNGIFCAGTASGRLVAVDFNSGVELGAIELDMEIRGIVSYKNSILVHGGKLRERAKSACMLTWEIASAAHENLNQ